MPAFAREHAGVGAKLGLATRPSRPKMGGVIDTANATPDFAVVAQGNLELLRDMQRALRSNGLRAELMQPPDGCGSS